MMKCLWCLQEVSLTLTWSSILNPPGNIPICHECETNLAYLPIDGCTSCNRETTADVCDDCKRWQQFYNGKDPLCQNISIFQYNDFLQEVIAKWKYRGDYILGELFRKAVKDRYVRGLRAQIPRDAVILPIPLSAERKRERAFNQASQLASFLPGEKVSTMTRTHGEKQSKKSRFARMHAQNPFILTKNIHNAVVLVDDIYTTGSTLRQAATVLESAGSPAVYALTLARG